jgi:hypothetical protein
MAIGEARGRHDATQTTRPSGALAAQPFVATSTGAASIVHTISGLDWLVLTYLAALLFALVFGQGPNRSACMLRVAGDIGIFVAALVLVRGQVLRWGSLASGLVYRFGILASVLGSYFQLREILPAVSPHSLDAAIYAFDLRVFGYEPSVAWDRFITRETTEWFAFFYFLYFLILSVHVLPMMLAARDTQRLSRFALGLLIVFCCAHLMYMLVPGYGPYSYLAGTFQHDLRGGLFWQLVRETVEAGGPQKDIFPSLHTAAPTYFAIFSFRHRDRMPFRYTWPVMAFVATQIIIATMFLRWHYLIDIVAGIALATTGSILGQRIADWEIGRRQRLGVQPAWMALPPLAWSSTGDRSSRAR